jgi:rhodanese-related sulfurtransferase
MIKLCLAAFAALLSAVAGASDAPAISADALQARIAGGDSTLVVLDVRTPKEFAAGHVPGARNIAFDEVEGRLAELQADRDRDVVVYCHSGRRAALALGTLEKAGFKRLYHLEGDYTGWAAGSRPVESEPVVELEPAPAY